MATREEVYQKFGMAAEAAQLLETELGTLLLTFRGAEEGLFFGDKPHLAREVLNQIDRSTLGRLLKQIGSRTDSPEIVEAFFANALSERNRLAHSFYRQHGVGINTPEGRDLMLQDLEKLHTVILDAYKAALLLSGIDLNAIVDA